MRRYGLLALWLAIAVGWLTPSAVFAQATGTITGVVTDEQGGVVPGVTIEVTNTATNQTRTATTGADGFYTVPLLQPGPYSVKATLQGFKTTVRDGVTVTVQSTSRVDVRLGVGALEESIRVTSEAPLVETSSASLGTVIDEKKIVELPLNGRNFTQLGTLIPGVVAPPPGLGGQAGDATPGGFGTGTTGFSVNGMRNQSNNFLLDGASNNDTFNTGFVLRPPPDAIQEFKIQTHSYSAEYGRNAGSVVNVVTKAGTNEFHGAGWEFNRDDALQARNFFAAPDQEKPKLSQHQFGGSLGGPIVRDRVFGFGYYEGYRQTRGNTTNVLVLTEAQRAGNFGSTTIRDPQTGVAFPNNTIPSDRIDPAAARLISDYMPLPNSGSNRYVASPDTQDDRNNFGGRVDYRLTQQHSILGRVLLTTTESITPPVTAPIGNTSKSTLTDYMGSHTFIVSQNAINVARLSFNRIDAEPTITSGLRNEDFGINVPNTNPLAAGLASVAISGYPNFGDAQQPFVKRENEVLQFSNDFTWTRAAHSMKFGFEYRNEQMVIASINRPNGDFTFNGFWSGNAAADFLLGLPGQFRRTTTNQPQDGSRAVYSLFAQDEWRAASNITVSAGLRYEISPPFEDVNDALNAFHPGKQSVRFPDAPAGLVYPGDPGIPRGTYATDKNNFAPRFGIVWDPSGEGRTSVRAAWGLFYDALAGQGDFWQSGVLAPPFTPLVEVNAPAALTLRDPLTVAGGSGTRFPNNLTIIGWAEDFTTPYAYHFNTSLQHQFGNSIGAEIGYVGSRGRNMPIFIEVNPGVYSPGQTTQGARIFGSAFALVRPTFSAADSSYNALQTSVRMRPRNGLNFSASYTLGSAKDHVSGLNVGGEQRPVLPVTIGDEASFEQALAFEWGNALFDVRHRFVLSFGYELPALDGQGALLRGILGGWQLNGIIQKQTGFPVSLTNSQLSIRYLTNRPDATCDPNEGAPNTVEKWFNTECFVARSLAETGERPGNAGRNTIRGPGFASTDLSLFKNIGLPNAHRIQLRLEAFNAFNQTRFNNPSGAFNTSNFGRITSAQDGRVIQLGVKYIF